ncbi:hypothetical protein DKX38_019096 [Salix brachista]|uniref:Cytochrome P450 n=1 Tax=Salix brachista TaxID=2182728 RepID=A0A5N5KQG2_9ROSI|nr:hypothetical protein DKX38_019096 [Salix brachista]
MEAMFSASVLADISPSFPMLFLLAALLLLSLFLKRKPSKVPAIPPGPKPWPLTGNVFQMGDKPHISLSKLAQVYGPLMSLRLGTQLVVIGSSREAASEILKTHDRELSGRCVPHVSFAKDPKLNEDSIAWTLECTDRWKFFRSLMRNELFSSKVVDGQSSTREAKAREMIDFLRKKEGERVKIRDIVFVYIFNALTNIYLSVDLLNYDQIGVSKSAWACRLDLQGLSRKCKEAEGRIQELWRGVIKERREGRNDTGDDDNSSKRKDFLDVLLDGEFSDEQISLFLVKVQLAFANLIHSFDWSLPNNMLPDELDMDEKYGITLMKEQPLELIPKWRK